MNVYCIPGLCASCAIFDNIHLPEGYTKKHIEWITPSNVDITLEEYALEMAKCIEPDEPFILLGYSFGGVIAQQMSSFLKPEKTIIISSFKSIAETPPLFKLVRKTRIATKLPLPLYDKTETVLKTLNKIFIKLPKEEREKILSVTDKTYVKWAIKHITEWIPKDTISKIYHIHGTADEIFSAKRIKDAIIIKGGDHMMLYTRSEEVSSHIESILNGG